MMRSPRRSVLDGVYRTTSGVPVFHSVRALTPEALEALTAPDHKTPAEAITRKGSLMEEQGMTYLAETDPDPALGPLQAVASTYRMALGLEAWARTC